MDELQAIQIVKKLLEQKIDATKPPKGTSILSAKWDEYGLLMDAYKAMIKLEDERTIKSIKS